MSKVSNALNMYFWLQNGRMIQGKELAESLEVSPRMIAKYKLDLEMAGVNIESKKGKYGGYYIERDSTIKSINITEEELEALKLVRQIIENKNKPYSKPFNMLATRLIGLKERGQVIDNVHITKMRNLPESYTEQESKLMTITRKAVLNNKKLRLTYTKLGESGYETMTRIIHPYGTVEYANNIYIYAYCEYRKDFRSFKLSRIGELEILRDDFKKENIDLETHFNESFGIYDDELTEFKLKIDYPFNELVKENTYHVNQHIEDLDEYSILYRAKLRGYKEIKAWILSMGSYVEVLEPEELRKDIRSELEDILKKYK